MLGKCADRLFRIAKTNTRTTQYLKGTRTGFSRDYADRGDTYTENSNDHFYNYPNEQVNGRYVT